MLITVRMKNDFLYGDVEYKKGRTYLVTYEMYRLFRVEKVV